MNVKPEDFLELAISIMVIYGLLGLLGWLWLALFLWTYVD
jgi:hypothetical protein